MTELIITGDKCTCDPNKKPDHTTLIITEGQTTVWGCKHVTTHEKKTTTKYIARVEH